MRYAPRIIGTAVAVAALAGPAVSFGAVAAVQDDRLPVVPFNQIDQRLELVRQSGARVTRVDLWWSDIAPTKPRNPTNPADPAYRWQRADRILGGLAARGIRPIVSVYSTPRWAAGRVFPGRVFNPYKPRNATDYGNFMQALARRYSGRFDVPGYGVQARVRHFEVWNEPNLQLYFLPQYAGGRPVSIKNYADLVRAAYKGLKRGNPRALVLAGVTGPKSSSNRTGLGTLDWIRGLRQQKPPFDHYSQHIYPAAGPRAATPAVPSWNSIPLLLRELNLFPNGRNKKMFITEAGYTTATTRFRNVKVTFAQQRTYLQQIFALPAVRQPRVPVVVWFNLQDNPEWPGGLITFAGTPKPSFQAFRTIALRTRTLPSVLRP